MALPTLSFAAPIDGNQSLIATLTYEFQDTTSGAGDWGGGASGIRLYILQNGTYTYGDYHPYTNTRTPYAMQYAFSPIAGYGITLGIGWSNSGPGTGTFWNIKLQGELVKR